MTTIAWDGKTLAVDSQAGGDYIHQGPVQKLFLGGPKDPCLAVAVSGDMLDAPLYVEWIQGKREKKPEGADFSALAVDRCGQCYVICSEHESKLKAGLPEAAGSGANFAMGAMLAGADAETAVAIASTLDVSTGGEIQVFHLSGR